MKIFSIINVLLLGNDETEILSLQQSLDCYGYQFFFSSGATKELKSLLIEYSPDAVLIQIDSLFLEKSLSFGRFLDKHGKVPFIYISSGGDDETLFRAQRTHPYCYLVKPFEPINLHISLQCALHYFKKQKISSTIMQQLHLEYDGLKMKVFNLHSNSSTVDMCNCYQFRVKDFTLLYKNIELKITKKERAFLSLLIAQLGSVVSFEQIVRFVWGSTHQSYHDVRVLTWKLNKKLPIALVKNAHGLGYYIES